MSPQTLAARVVGWQLVFSTGVALCLHSLLPFLLLLEGEQARASSLALSLAVLLGSSVSIAQGWSLIWARRSLLSHLTEKGQRTHHHIEIPKLNDDPWHIVNAWLYSGALAVLAAMTILRPAALPPATALTLGLFAAIILAAASLPLLMLVRRDFVRLMEQVPPDIMAEIIDAQVRSGRLRGRTSRRLLAALTTPVAFLVIGSALIAGAHLRSFEETARSSAARALVQATLAPSTETPSNVLPVASQDMPGALEALGALSNDGYRVQLHEWNTDHTERRTRNGVVEMHLPLASGSALVRFAQNSGWGMNWRTIPVALIAMGASMWVGIGLARLLSRDLRMANHGVRMLGTDAALEGTRVMRPARFRAVAELSTAIESLSDRFRQFAKAQANAIEARESATRARGRFFASVSHDLKSPLNAILGFAELCRSDPEMQSSQRESLELILHRGRELLSLIETILDAARVEAGQLHLDIADEQLSDLLETALNKARDLTSDRDVLIRLELPDDLPPVPVDRLRFSQALATFLAHARRTAERDTLRVLAEAEPLSPRPSLRKRKVTLHIEVPSSRFSAQDLTSMLHPEQQPGHHRGLSLALRLAKSVIELHGGTVQVTGRTVREPAFAITLNGRPGK